MDEAAVWCSYNALMLGGVRLGSGMTGKVGSAWVCAWVHGWWVGGEGVDVTWNPNITSTPSPPMHHTQAQTYALPTMPVILDPNPNPPNRRAFELH